MERRKLSNTGFDVSILGYGTMRLPRNNSTTESIEEKEAIKLIRHSIDEGVNFVDTAYIYHQGQSEVVLGKALKDGYREKAYLMDKLPVWLMQTPDDYERLLNEQLKRLDVETIDIYLFHALNAGSFQGVLQSHLYERALRAKEAGKIRAIGWSFHGEPELIPEIVDAGIGDVALMQYNIVDRKNEEGIAYAAEKGMGVILMGPVGGGRLATPPADVITSMKAAGRKHLTSEMALRFVWSNPNVSIALSGMSNAEQVSDNLNTAKNYTPLTQDDTTEIEDILVEYQSLTDLYCTGCKYCLPCPQGVNIPINFELMNYHKVFGASKFAKEMYGQIGLWPDFPGQPASACTECGECEPKCPQDIPIIEQLKEVEAVLRK